ncbi:bromodomain-containing protein bet-1 [Drosophila sechellia]|uniref:GM21941 n=1 Tax=Drosophila sechellia TaxID=7238 RepID=B4HPD1_DROSE|nr:bromodomain-containing protein bet-1 [Drosophila sechellia]EDW48569.1 GM21941 [Drosophila sechellia]
MANSKPLSVKLKLPNRVQPEYIPHFGKAGCYTNKLHYFKKHFLDEARKKKYALDFLEPVDTDALKVPTYYTVINHPMDIGTILKRVQNNYYKSVNDAIADFKLIISNCFLFNRPGDVVHRKGQMLEKFFQKKLRGLPSGPEVPCNRDPSAVGRPRTNAPSAAQTELKCREILKKLQSYTNQTDAMTRNFFNNKWDSLQKRVDRQYFNSVHDFCFHVDTCFRKYLEPAKILYEGVFNKPAVWCTSMNGMLGSSLDSALNAADLNELLAAAKLAENRLMQCVQEHGSGEPLRAKNLVETFCDTLKKMINKMEAGQRNSSKPSYSKRQKLIPKPETDLVQGEFKPAIELLNGNEIDNLMAVSIESSDDEAIDTSTPVTDAERCATQKLFAKLPTNAMKEIIHMVQQIEGFSSENCGDLSFDVKAFATETMVLMKSAVTKASRAHSKLKLKDMQPSEKEGLQRALQSQLVNITRMLNKNRRRCGPLINCRNKTINSNNVVRKRAIAPLSAKLKPPQANVMAPQLGAGVVESHNLSDTSDEDVPPPMKPQPAGGTPMGTIPRNNNPPQQPVISPNLPFVVELSSSSSSESEMETKSGRASRSRSRSRSSSSSSSRSRSSSRSSSSSGSSSSAGSGSRPGSRSSSPSSNGSDSDDSSDVEEVPLVPGGQMRTA